MIKQLTIFILILVNSFCYQVPTKWHQSNDLTFQNQQQFKFLISLKQQNIDVLKNLSGQISDPDHSNYGKHLTSKQIAQIIKLQDQEIEKVQNWIKSQVNTTICPLILNLTAHNDHIIVQTCFANIQKIFPNVTFQTYTHPAIEKKILRTKTLKNIDSNLDYLSVPKQIQQYINAIHQVTDLPVLSTRQSRQLNNFAEVESGYDKIITSGINMIPSSISKVYGNPINQTNDITAINQNPQSQQAVAEFTNNNFNQNGYSYFNNIFGLNNTKIDVIGDTSSTSSVEAMLDIEYISINNIQTRFLNIDGFNLIEWAYSVYSDETSPLVQSMSYGTGENEFNSMYLEVVNIEFLKLGLQGFTVLIASGDDGAYQRTGCQNFEPSFPASSPYVTAVGATYIDSLYEEEKAANFSGGGFSNQFTRPSYQDELVTAYLQNHSQQSDFPNQQNYNSNNRAIPDVSAFGTNYIIIQDGQARLVSGTSASAPTFASIISYINAKRLTQKLPPLGFLNPAIYKLKSVGYDITVGNNNNACNTLGGYPAAIGYDAISGLGAPRYEFLEQNLIKQQNSSFIQNQHLSNFQNIIQELKDRLSDQNQ